MKIDYDVGDVVVRVGGDPALRPMGAIRRVKKFHTPDRDGSIGVSFQGESRPRPWKAENWRKLPKADASFTSLIKRKTAPKRVRESA